MEIEKRLYEAAVEGDVKVLRELLEQDALILDRLTLTCFNETPLHIASMRGHIEFVKFILTRNPLLAAELDSQRSSALHVASIKGYIEIVKELLVVNPEMCVVGDREGRNPLHLAVIKGRVEVIKELVRVSHLAALQTTDRDENVLHLCVKHNNQLEALNVLMELISDDTLLKSRDGDGYSILHLAVADKQIQTVKYLLKNNKIEVNLKDDNGNTPLDILTQSRRDMNDLEIGDCLRDAGGLRAKDMISSSYTQNGAKCSNSHVALAHKHNILGDWLSRKRDTIMVVASLIATMAFQAGMNPPGGVWQENKELNSHVNPLQIPHKAGEAVMAYTHPKSYRYFIRVNTTAFVASLSTILLLISGLPFRKKFFMWALMVIMWLTITSIALTYGISIYIVTPKKDREQLGQVIEVAVTVWSCVMTLLLLGNTIRLVYLWMMKKKQQSRTFETRISGNLVHDNV
ncbi:ankyrin repeat-containing protein ITN1-like [Solanum lycopersicum]|uniref:PGG domain-containing protein n=1 Tax=Solanum lycopersicum TaxID=4081 RepID=A0A3Q7HQ13_SOLLC|nr:ankyrin repeat-containing protein ITN1-like [Solanum lycopersicum]